MRVDVSVIIATYNVERYIERAVNSVLRQENITLEVIIVDDCSTDNTWHIVSAMPDPRIRCFQLPQNSGPGAARNKGFEIADGAWVAILDSDDQFLPGHLLRCVSRAKEQNADIVVDNIQVIREEDGSEFPMFPQAFMQLRQLDLATFIKGQLPHSTNNYTLGYLKPVFSSAFLHRHHLAYDLTLRIGEDYMLMAEALALGAYCAMEPVAGYLYTARTGSISHRLSLANISHMLAADAKFTSRHTLAPDAADAQHKRELSLKKEYAYTQLVDAIKKKNMSNFFRTMLSYPSALLLLYRPLEARMQRLMRRIGTGAVG